MAEINGKASEYHNEQYEKLVKTVVPLRNEFRRSKTLKAREEIAAEELGLWKEYLAHRRGEIDEGKHPDFEIDPKTLSMLRD